MTSDHLPTKANFAIDIRKVNKQQNNIKKIKRIYWKDYTSVVDLKLKEKISYSSIADDKDFLDLYQKYIDSLKEAENESVKYATRKIGYKTLPKYILEIIKERKKIAKKLKKNKNNKSLQEYLKCKFNQLTRFIKTEQIAIQKKKWSEFFNDLEKNKTNSAEFWKKIKSVESLKDNYCDKKSSTIPDLHYNGKVIQTAQDKANLFGKILEEIFSESNNRNYNEEHKLMVEDYLNINKNYLFTTKPDEKAYDDNFSENELLEAIKNLNKKAAPGIDRVTNKNIINLSETGKKIILDIINYSWKNSCVIDEWKVAEITMIPKDQDDKNNPNKYRPISLTNSVIKLMEKMVKKRLMDYLDKHQILSIYQSGFREKRQTVDNLVYFTQKAIEAFDENKYCCGVVFDIMKAFDKVWLNGLIYKLALAGLPNKLGNWIKEFISNRKFCIKVENEKSSMYNIQAGVPQGAILSPILFSIFINDIVNINSYPNDKIESLLFADDLFSFNIDKNINRMKLRMQRYLNYLENWFNQWRLSIAANKCSYTIYSKRKLPKEIANGTLKFMIYNTEIPLNHNPKYLGITLDRNLKFTNHIENIKNKCEKQFNILKCLSFKKWALEPRLQLRVYKSLIRSNIEYASILLILTEKNIKTLSSIQYHALRIIYKEKIGCSNQYLHDISGIGKIEDRLSNLSSRYIEMSILNKNPLITKLLNEITWTTGSMKTPLESIGFNL